MSWPVLRYSLLRHGLLKMRIFISTLLLALFGNKKDTKCTGEEELTGSYIPAGIQVLNHYLTQIRGAYEAENEAGRNVRAATSFPDVPTILVNYQVVNSTESRTIKRLEKLESALDGEASDQGLGDCKGFSAEVLRQLEKSSRLTSSGQLSFILKNISKGELKRPTTKILVKGILTELENRDSELYKCLTLVVPLKYLSDISLE